MLQEEGAAAERAAQVHTSTTIEQTTAPTPLVSTSTDALCRHPYFRKRGLQLRGLHRRARKPSKKRGPGMRGMTAGEGAGVGVCLNFAMRKVKQKAVEEQALGTTEAAALLCEDLLMGCEWIC
eukprot:scaffold183810_cov16-Tisochrysis_lutea.AAC.1